MDDILTALYRAFAPETMTTEESSIIGKYLDEIERIESQLSSTDLALYTMIQAQLSGCRAEAAFALGFRLAIQISDAIHE